MAIFIKLLAFFIISSTVLTAQMEDETMEDSTSVEDNSTFNLPFFKSDLQIESNVPTIDLNYGMRMHSYEDGAFDYTNASDIGIKIGFTDYDRLKNSETVIESDFDYVFLDHSSNEIGGMEIENDEFGVETWQWGFGTHSGYGWKLGEKSNIILYNGDRLVWTKLTFDNNNDPDILALTEEPVHNKFGDSFRFGATMEGGIKARIIENVGIHAEYSRTQVYPRHMFWYWTGSEIIEGIAQGVVIGYFIKYVEKSSPNLVPIVDFILRNGIAYGFNELRKDKMNWPINTAAPFDIQTIKVGLSFYF